MLTSSAGPDVTGGEDYVAGVLAALGVAADLEVDIASDVPVGAGLSSSAALECSVAVAVDALLDLGLDRRALRDACIRAETEHVGAPTGGLDQTTAMFARERQALLLDFATGDVQHLDLDLAAVGLVLLVVDTGVRHRFSEADGGYGARRRDAEQAAHLLGVGHLVDAAPDALDVLPEELLPRARHVVTEQQRVDDFVAAVGAGDWDVAGRHLTASHASLRDDYEVSCAELDAAVAAALDAGALGARMTGGGFGGCAIALVPEETADAVTTSCRERFRREGWPEPPVFAVTPSDGARVDP